jgi:hypothetical protein
MHADVAELVDALASGASASDGVKVQVLSSAPNRDKTRKLGAKVLFFLWFCYAKPKCFQKQIGVLSAARAVLVFLDKYRLNCSSGNFFSGINSAYFV